MMTRVILRTKSGSEICELKPEFGYYVIPEEELVLLDIGDELVVEEVYTEE